MTTAPSAIPRTLSMLIKDKQIYWDLVEFIKDIKKHPWKLILKH